MGIKASLVALCCFLLSGCVAMVVVGTAGMVVYERRTMVMIEKDMRIFHLLRKALVSDPRFEDSHIVVTSFNQVVLLTGQTTMESLRTVADKMAQNTPHVRRVYNEITLGISSSLAQQSEDLWITGQVRSLMLTQKGLESGSIRILTENGVVYLMGIVSHEQANLAVGVARKVKGVRRVVKIFQYFA